VTQNQVLSNGDGMKLKMMARSDVGTARSINEDFCGIFKEDGLAIVCDGMGGHNAGAEASRLSVTTIRYMYRFLDPSIHNDIAWDLIAQDLEPAARLVSSIRLANRNVYNKSIQQSELMGMGTTVSALAIRDDLAVISHVGDSRVYRFRQEKMDLLTEDHTWVNELIQDEEIDREEAKNFQKQNVITRAIGMNGSIKIDVRIESVQQGDLFLICTDGLTKALSDEEIERIIQFNRGNFDHTLRHLIDTSTMKDGSDNITAVLVEVEECDPVDSIHEPIYLTLKPENKQITRLEDRILKRELYYRVNSESPGNNVTKVIKKQYGKITGFVTSMIFIIFIGVYAFSNHGAKQNSNPGADIQPNLASNNLPNETGGMQRSNQVQKNVEKPKQSSKPDTKPLPDSVVNKMISASFDNQENKAPASKVRSRSLQRGMQNRGKIYLTGLEKFKNLENTTLFINDNYWGKTEDLRNKDLILRPGSYSITIRDSTERILFQKKSIKVSAGDIKAIEIKGR